MHSQKSVKIYNLLNCTNIQQSYMFVNKLTAMNLLPDRFRTNSTYKKGFHHSKQFLLLMTETPLVPAEYNSIVQSRSQLQQIVKATMALYLSHHLKMPQSSFDSPHLLLWASGLPAIRGLGLIKVLPQVKAVFSLHLGDIQVRDMETIVLLHPVADFVIGSLALRCGHIHFVHIDFHFDVLMGFIEFGQKTYRFDVHRTSLMSHFFRPRLRLMNGFRMSLQNCLRNPFLFPQ